MERTTRKKSAKRDTKQKTTGAKIVTRRLSLNPVSNLRNLNFLAGALLAVQGIVLLLISDPTRGLQAVTANFLGVDKVASTATGKTVTAPGASHLFDLNLAYVVAAFLFIGAIAHIYIATNYRSRYETELNNGVNRARWIEYAFSGGLMMVAVSLLVGVFDLASLLVIFGLTALMSLLGLLMERVNQGRANTNWLPYILGGIAGALSWLVIVIYLVSAHVHGNGTPAFAYWAALSLFVLVDLIALNFCFRYKKVGRWTDYLYNERVYILLSFVAKTALAWQIFAGTLR